MVGGISSEEEFQKYRSQVFDFLWQEVEPLATEIDRTSVFPKATLFKKFSEHGLWGLLIPTS